MGLVPLGGRGFGGRMTEMAVVVQKDWNLWILPKVEGLEKVPSRREWASRACEGGFRHGSVTQRLAIHGSFGASCSEGLSLLERSAAVVRGGSWHSNTRNEPAKRSNNIGFRRLGDGESGRSR